MNQFPPSPQGGLGSGMGFPFSGGGFGAPSAGVPQPPQTGTGGILSRILGGGGGTPQSLPMPPGSFPALQRGVLPGVPQQAGGMLSRILPGAAGQGGMDMMGMIQNVQKVMQAADTIKPMVQQYGPMVKQLPEMIALFKEYQNSGDTSDDSEEEETDEEPVKTKKKTNKSKAPKKPPGTATKKKKESISEETVRKSKPKLYV